MTIVVYTRHTPEVNSIGTAQVALAYFPSDVPLNVLLRNWNRRAEILTDAHQEGRQEYDRARAVLEGLMGGAHDFEFISDTGYNTKYPLTFATREMSKQDYAKLLLALNQFKRVIYQAQHVINPVIHHDVAKEVLDDLVSRTWKSNNGASQSSQVVQAGKDNL